MNVTYLIVELKAHISFDGCSLRKLILLMIKQLKADFGKQEENFLEENFLVVAKDNGDKSYFIARAGEETTDDFFWCKANRPLKLREMVNGYLDSDAYLHVYKMPELIIQ